MNWYVAKSAIHGNGVFAARSFLAGEKIDTGIEFFLFLLPIITAFGRKINHQWTPSAQLRYNSQDHTYDVHAKNDIEHGEEITLDYRDTPFFIDGPKCEW